MYIKNKIYCTSCIITQIFLCFFIQSPVTYILYLDIFLFVTTIIKKYVVFFLIIDIGKTFIYIFYY